MSKILVIGSLNMDFVIEVDQMPKKGETIFGKNIKLVPGGKGANQAYSVGKLGGEVSMIGAVGDDVYGKALISSLESVGVNTSGIKVIKDEPTGNAFITVDRDGDNSIIVVAGTNNCVTKEMIDHNIALIDDCDSVVMQLEIPLETVEYAACIAREKGKRVILDPAPAPQYLPENLIKNVNIMKPNETELQTLTGMQTETREQVITAAKVLIDKGVEMVIVTLGEKGSILVSKEEVIAVESERVVAVDTTAAGDCFTAAFTVALTQGKSYEEAVKYGNKVSAIVVTRKGAQASIPTADEVEQLYK
ncbi:MAG TPA: ribokinase [Epulopiscium sp.]|nr:ribokinase [Candidatus Epulonipiscium sp.]